MSELDNAIKRLKENADNRELPYIIVDIIKKNCSQEVIDLILQYLDEDGNANPIEAMKCLKNIYTFSEDTIYQFEKEYNIIKQALIKSQEQEQVLKILKEKHLFEPTHKYIVDYSKDYATYCKLFESYKLDKANKLIEEEFELLKAYFEKKYVKVIARNVRRGS